jgi:hypothetical protein
LRDSNGDGNPDTGPVAQGAVVTVTVQVDAPRATNVGDHDDIWVRFVSSRDEGKSASANLRPAVPAPFAQVYAADEGEMMNRYLYLAHPYGQRERLVLSEKYRDPWFYERRSLAVVELPGGGWIYAWPQGDSAAYMLLDRSGKQSRPISRLSAPDPAPPGVEASRCQVSVAVTPNGRIGIFWRRGLYDPATGRSKKNLYFAVLDRSGEPIYGPVNLTGNTGWDHYPDYDSLQVAATGDSRFLLAWERVDGYVDGQPVADIYFAIRDGGGNELKAPARLTHCVPGDSWYSSPVVIPVAGGRALIAFLEVGDISDLLFAVLDSDGDVVHPIADLDGDSGSGRALGLDATELSDGRILVSWTDWHLYFVVLDSAYNRVAGPVPVYAASRTGNWFVSAVADADGHAILTWSDGLNFSASNLYYALVNGDGQVLTPGMPFYSRPASLSELSSSYYGSGSASYSFAVPTTDGVDARLSAPQTVGARPGSAVAVSVQVSNHGRTPASEAVLEARLDEGLTYDASTPQPATVDGNKVTWELPDLAFLGQARITLQLGVPQANLGTTYKVHWSVTAAGVESHPQDNAAICAIIVSSVAFLPLVLGSAEG